MSTEVKTYLSLGEAMVEMAPVQEALYKRGFAGDTLNTAWYLRAFLPDAWRVGYVTALGDDPLSHEMAEFIQQNGIDTGSIRHISGKTCGLYLISLKDGERSFSYWRHTSAAREMVQDRNWLTSAVNGADKLFLSGISIAILPPDDRQTLLHILTDLASQGREIAFDPNVRLKLWEDENTCRDWISKFAAISTTVLPSFEDEQNLFSDRTPTDTCSRYLNAGTREVAVKNGKNTVAFCQLDSADIQSMDITEIRQPKDTTGAGDSFNGAYLACRSIGVGQEHAVKQAAALSARVINTHGALLAMSEARQIS